MGSWGPGALDEYKEDCIARGGKLVPDPMMAVTCIEPKERPIPPGKKKNLLHPVDSPPLLITIPPGEKESQGGEFIPIGEGVESDAPSTVFDATTPPPRRFNTTIILIIVILLVVLLLGSGAAFMFMR
jgi:hypothetical protein